MTLTFHERCCRQVLEGLAERNGTIDLAPVKGSKAVGVCRVRILTICDDAMLVQTPTDAQGVALRTPGLEVHVLATDGAQRWEFFTSVIEATEHRLNETNTVPAVKLAVPDDVRSAQRRDGFRVGTGSMAELDAVTVRALAGKDYGWAEVGPVGADPLRPFKASLANLSSGGICVQVPPDLVEDAGPLHLFHCTLSLPGVCNALALRAQRVHLTRFPNGAWHMGLRFHYHDPAARRRGEELINHFVFDLQRQQLKRQRDRR